MRGLVPKFIMLIICLLHINYRPFDPCERVLNPSDVFRVRKAGFPNENGTQSTTTAGFPYCHAMVTLVVMMFAQG